MANKAGSGGGGKVKKGRSRNRYVVIIEEVFRRHFKRGLSTFAFDREEFMDVASSLEVKLPKNLGDLNYSFRYRAKLPESITSTAPQGLEWTIAGAGRSRYEFRLVKPIRIVPRENLMVIKVPDATPEIIAAYSLGDEQALLAKVRYNRLIDIFLGIAASSLQNHLRTTVRGIGQIEIDELYVGIDRTGCQYVVPVQAKGGSDCHGRQQTEQDIACCSEKFPRLKCRPVSAQFMSVDRIAMFELGVQDGEICVVSEEHFELVPASKIDDADLVNYAQRRSAR